MLIEDKSLNDFLENQREEAAKKNDSVLRNLRDGDAFKSNSYFMENPGGYAAWVGQRTS